MPLNFLGKIECFVVVVVLCNILYRRNKKNVITLNLTQLLPFKWMPWLVCRPCTYVDASSYFIYTRDLSKVWSISLYVYFSFPLAHDECLWHKMCNIYLYGVWASRWTINVHDKDLIRNRNEGYEKLWSVTGKSVLNLFQYFVKSL